MAKPEDEQEVLPRLPVVGIGGSAGGLRALQALFETLPADTGAAFVVIMHLDPSHSSELSQILSHKTKMRVLQVDEKTPLAPNTVYVIPPNRRLRLSGNDIETAAFDEPRGQRAPIDQFFRSIAEEHGDGFAIVLSGGGSDGAVGVRAVKEKGGIILVQDPIEAEFASMPQNAIISGVDFVLPVRDLAHQLATLIVRRASIAKTIDFRSDDAIVDKILEFLRAKSGQDFSRYKRATILRRLLRRMQVTGTEKLANYYNYIQAHAEEVDALFKDLLISVTSFFRDGRAFKTLADNTIPNLFKKEQADDPIRVWVAGCATGEEVYSIAILLLEEADRQGRRFDIQMFATDLDHEALKIAREGRYPLSISADVSEIRLRRFFTRDGDFYRIRRELRDLVVFAFHNVLKDPPFSRLDLICCRNLLIYVDRGLQQQVVRIFHYSLLSSGYLFLGSSESAEAPPGLFSPIDREARIYQSSYRRADHLPTLSTSFSTVRLPDIQASTRRATAPPNDSAIHRRALEDLSPPSMLVNEDYAVVNLSETAGRYLLHPSGPVTNIAPEIVRPELQLELRAALHTAFEQNKRSLTLPIPVRFNGVLHPVVLQVLPSLREEGRHALIIFLEGAASSAEDIGTVGASETSNPLQEELSATRSYLRTTREQYEAATEELRAANEELQSINEEYRSTAEELETSKEELQSINEELQTLNNEMKIKLEVVSRAHNDLQNLITATDVGTLFLDRNMRIKLFTPRIGDIFNIVTGDEGRPVTDFTHHLEYQELVDDARRVLADLVPVERAVESTTGRWFLARLRPYRTTEDKIDGIVAAFVDITERRNTDAAWVAQQKVLLDELTHRVKNTLAVVQAIARQTLNDCGVKPEKLKALDARIQALAKSHDLLVSNDWKGAGLDAIARAQLAPHLLDGSNRVTIKGPTTFLPPAMATPVTLVLHELATNAAKYGSLSTSNGRVLLEWTTIKNSGKRAVKLIWSEHGGPPVTAPHNESFGTATIKHAIADAKVDLDYRPDGLVCTIVMPLKLLPETFNIAASKR
jgi:two-component system CheB/CheR fusion protein